LFIFPGPDLIRRFSAVCLIVRINYILFDYLDLKKNCDKRTNRQSPLT